MGKVVQKPRLFTRFVVVATCAVAYGDYVML